MKAKNPKHVHAFIDSRGKPRFVLRRPGCKRVSLPGLPWSPTFMTAYEAAMAGEPVPIAVDPIKTGSLRALTVAYFASTAFLTLASGTRHIYRVRLDHVCQIKDSKGLSLGDRPAAGMRREHVLELLAKKATTPGAANELRKVLRALMQYAVDVGLRADDPTVSVKALKMSGDGYHSWTDDEIATFEARHPIGSQARLAEALLLFLGQRRSDTVRMGRQHVRAGTISVRQMKTKAALDIPLHSDLADIIAATPSNHLTFLVSDNGEPFTKAEYFSKWFRRQCDAAGLPRACSAHGLRKAAARRLVEAGCSTHEVASITGHASLREIERYTKAANQQKLAIVAIGKIKRQTPTG